MRDQAVTETRRRTLLAMGLAGLGALVDGAAAASAPVSRPRAAAGDPAWRALLEGNRRWAAGRPRHPHEDPSRRAELTTRQRPYAVVLSCIDSRVPPELVFDAGVGDLMVVRTAAHTVDPLIREAVDFGPHELGTRLVVVLGHQRCGAVTASVEALAGGREPRAVREIVRRVRPAYEDTRGARGDRVDAVVRRHTERTAAALGEDAVLRERIAHGRLRIVGAYYSLDTGLVSRLV